MPTYEYQCTSCQHGWEAEQSMKDEPLKECPSCHGATAKRLISMGTGFILRGGGAAGPSKPSIAADKSLESAMNKRFEQVSGIKRGDG